MGLRELLNKTCHSLMVFSILPLLCSHYLFLHESVNKNPSAISHVLLQLRQRKSSKIQDCGKILLFAISFDKIGWMIIKKELETFLVNSASCWGFLSLRFCSVASRRFMLFEGRGGSERRRGKQRPALVKVTDGTQRSGIPAMGWSDVNLSTSPPSRDVSEDEPWSHPLRVTSQFATPPVTTQNWWTGDCLDVKIFAETRRRRLKHDDAAAFRWDELKRAICWCFLPKTETVWEDLLQPENRTSSSFKGGEGVTVARQKGFDKQNRSWASFGTKLPFIQINFSAFRYLKKETRVGLQIKLATSLWNKSKSRNNTFFFFFKPVM